MSVRQGNNILAGGVVCDNTPTSGSQNAVSSGGVYTALAGKVSIGHEVIEFQAPNAGNNYTWYRKYADGWVEQGGQRTVDSYGVEITMPIVMADSNYSVQITTSQNVNSFCRCYSRTTTYVSIATSGYSLNASWQVSGMAA